MFVPEAARVRGEDRRRWATCAPACVFLAIGIGGSFSRAVAPAPNPAANHAATATTESFRGESLLAVLRTLERSGLPIVFTSELVRPEMLVEIEPTSREPRRVLDEILAPHRLRVEEAPGGVLVIVRGSLAASLGGAVVALGSRAALAGALVRVLDNGAEVRAAADGSFAFAELAVGTYSVEASADGYLEQRVDGIDVTASATRRVLFQLHPQIYLQDEVVVRPSRLSLLLDAPDSSFSLARSEIAGLPHLGGDVFRAASLLPGVVANDVTAQFSVHGGRRDEVRVLLDGQELYGAYHLKDYDSALSVVPATSLEGVSLTTGSYPVHHGDRMSAILDLRTLEPPAERRALLALSVLDALASSSGRFAAGRGAWLATGRRGSLDLAGDAIGGEDPGFWDLFGKAEFTTGLGLFGARVLVAHDRLSIDQSGADGFERLTNDYQSTYAWLTHQGILRERLLAETLGSWAGIETNRGGAGLDEEVEYGLSDRRNVEVSHLSQNWSLDLGPHQLARWGFEARRYDVFFAYAKNLQPDIVVLAPFSAPRTLAHDFQGDLRGEHLGIWASDRFTVRDRLTAELGLRYDRHALTNDTLFSPRVNLGWRLGERGVVRASWGRFFQSQRPYELQVEDGEETLRPAELSAHWLLGYEALLERTRLGVRSLRVELFRREITDPRPRYESLLEPINFFPETEPDRVRIAPESSSASGVELLLRGGWGARFDWWIAYAYARSRDRLAGATVARALDQPHSATLDLHFRLPRHWDLNLAWRVHSGWPATPVGATRIPDAEDPEEEPELVAVFGRLNSQRLPLYHRLDLRASREWQLRASRLTFFVDVQNVYDRKNLAGYDLDLDEEAGTVALEAEHWPGVFPSLGVSWEF
jgi:TonB dependent receptor/Carboxypeptidase regulatory-like domain